MPHSFEIGLTLRSEKYEDDDDRWRQQVAGLVQELRPETDALRRVRTPIPGTKGTIDDLILSLGSAGAFTMIEHVFRSWLARDKTRSIDLTYVDARDHVRHLQVDAANASDDVFQPVLAAIAHHIENDQ